MALDGLTRQQGFALIFEMDSARYLLRHGDDVLRTTKYIDLTIDAILTTLSIGVEKLLKLALGLGEVADGKGWPDKRTMQKGFGHGTLEMDAKLRARLREGIELKPYARTILAEVDADPVWPALLAALDAYGQSGRFYNLDTLAMSPQQFENPRHLWDAIEQIALANDPKLAQMQQDVFDDLTNPQKMDDYEHALLVVIANSLRRWWRMVAILAKRRGRVTALRWTPTRRSHCTRCDMPNAPRSAPGASQVATVRRLRALDKSSDATPCSRRQSAAP